MPTLALLMPAFSIICTVTNRSGYMNGTSTAQASFPCPAKDHWAVTYNANGGSGAPGAQTKWHGEVLTISGTRPTRANHTFQGWSTSAGGAVQYAPNSRYGMDGGATLYAVWKIGRASCRERVSFWFEVVGVGGGG